MKLIIPDVEASILITCNNGPLDPIPGYDFQQWRMDFNGITKDNNLSTSSATLLGWQGIKKETETACFFRMAHRVLDKHTSQQILHWK